MGADFKFLIPLGFDDRTTSIDLATSLDVGLEITAFIGGDPLNDPNSRQLLESEIACELAAFSGVTTMHGAFLDLAIHSGDNSIARVSRDRIERDIATAIRLGCEKVVFHFGQNPLIAGNHYRDSLLAAHAEFWPRMLDAYPDVVICLENQFEPEWGVFCDLFNHVPNPRLGMCLDVAHAHVYGHFGPDAWMRAVDSKILHMHWSDNSGDRDSHLALGAGNLEWRSVIDAAADWNATTTTLEISSIIDLQRSFRFLGRRGVFQSGGDLTTMSPAWVPR